MEGARTFYVGMPWRVFVRGAPAESWREHSRHRTEQRAEEYAGQLRALKIETRVEREEGL